MDGLVLVAAGSSTRFGGTLSKVLRRLAGTPVILRSLAPFLAAVEDLFVVVAARREDVPAVRSLLPRATVVEGGAERQESVWRGLEAVPPTVQVALVHDAARPLVSAALVRRVLEAARRDGAAVPVVPVQDTLHRVAGPLGADGARVLEGVDRELLVAAQTPQAAHADLLRRALAAARAAGSSETDEVGALRRAGVPVTAVEGERWNLKITTPEDLELAERLLAEP
jgi:2-C-methyl-D-erythritol 4-phosphate cytidylyltransferase